MHTYESIKDLLDKHGLYLSKTTNTHSNIGRRAELVLAAALNSQEVLSTITPAEALKRLRPLASADTPMDPGVMHSAVDLIDAALFNASKADNNEH